MDEVRESTQTFSVVIPVFRAADTLERVVIEIVDVFQSADFRNKGMVLREIILVNDCGQDGSTSVMRALQSRYELVRVIWLSRNFGQHPATVAGLASSQGNWIVTMDDDGQHNPFDIYWLHEKAMDSQADLVYGKFSDPPTRNIFRKVASKFLKTNIISRITGRELEYFSSYRLMLGEIGRSVAAYANSDVYLDIALSWFVRNPCTRNVTVRKELRAQSTYSARKLFHHALRLVISSGTRPLRLGSLIGFSTFALGLVSAVAIAIGKIFYGIQPVGWASLASIVLVVGGLNLLVLGIISEYVGHLVRTANGRPSYVIIDDPQVGPLSAEAKAESF